MATGSCRYCGQTYEVFDNDNLTQRDYDNIATDKCTCEGAASARKIHDWQTDVREANKRVIRPVSNAVADVIDGCLDPVAIGKIKVVNISFDSDDAAMKATLRYGKTVSESLKLTSTRVTTISDTIMNDDADNYIPVKK